MSLSFEHTQRINKLAKKLFVRFDIDGSSTLNLLELKAVLRKLDVHKECETEAQFDQMAADELQKADLDGSGTLTFDEFKAYFNALKDRFSIKIYGV
jgi:Ca2+-binding EF-hand superfamily protein